MQNICILWHEAAATTQYIESHMVLSVITSDVKLFATCIATCLIAAENCSL